MDIFKTWKERKLLNSLLLKSNSPVGPSQCFLSDCSMKGQKRFFYVCMFVAWKWMKIHTSKPALGERIRREDGGFALFSGV